MDIFRHRESKEEKRRLTPSAIGLVVGIGVLTVSAWFQYLSEYPAENRRREDQQDRQEQQMPPPEDFHDKVETFIEQAGD